MIIWLKMVPLVRTPIAEPITTSQKLRKSNNYTENAIELSSLYLENKNTIKQHDEKYDEK